ncbi:MAG: hypothetical protein EAZ06_00545 [Cytophagales bacterium]|nr:MAG: hypothetical protein EAZ27_05055 [Cytophagales bacterium]TAH31346.1 MAG: hypothetical protein EAZ06_00545 [Cytophagales bacterium]
MSLFIHIKKNTPLVFSELTEFIAIKYPEFKNLEIISSYVFIGIMLDYLNENCIEMSLSDISLQTLEEEIISTLMVFEETIKHYS